MKQLDKRSDRDGASPPAPQRLSLSIAVPAGVLLIWTAWAWSGLRTAWLWPSVGAGAALLGVALARGRGWRRDPAFWLGGLFLIWLALQWLNAGRELYLDVGLHRWVHAPPRLDWLPSAFSRAEAAQALMWFFPAWGLIVALREPAFSRRTAFTLFAVLIYASAALATLGIAQYATGTRSMYGLARMNTFFFASFGYPNHAAAYFLMIAALACGFLFHELFHAYRAPCRNRVAGMTIAAILCLVGAILSMSRAGIILTGFFIFLCALTALIRGLREWRVAGKINLVFATLALVVTTWMIVVGLGEKDIRQEFEVRDPAQVAFLPRFLQRVNLHPHHSRYDLTVASIRMWKDHRWFGTGCWGFRHLLAFYVPEHDWPRVIGPSGRANVHNDVLQFLTEFGLIGFGLGMVGVPVAMLASLMKSRMRPSRALLRGFALLALGIALVFALFDLPFRCPAILYAWCAIFAGLPKLTGGGREGRARHDEYGRPRQGEKKIEPQMDANEENDDKVGLATSLPAGHCPPSLFYPRLCDHWVVAKSKSI